MSTSQQLNILFPAGRLVQGDLYKPQTKDQQGNPLVIKTGPNAGKPTQKYFFALAIAKAPGEGHWANTAWGKLIWDAGHLAWPQGQAQAPTFAWKVEDGDNAVPNKVGRKNCDREGFPGHWIVNFSSTFAPKIYNTAGEPINEVGAVKTGYYVEVMGSITSNENSSNPGMYVNHNMVALRGYGAEIVSGPDPKAVGFGKSALPAGASAAPTGAAANFPAAAAAAPQAAPPPPAAAPVAMAAPPPQTAVAPSPSFIAPPAPGAGAPPPPAAAAPPPPAAGPQMTAKAAGQSYAAFIAAGWTDANLRLHGYML